MHENYVNYNCTKLASLTHNKKKFALNQSLHMAQTASASKQMNCTLILIRQEFIMLLYKGTITFSWYNWTDAKACWGEPAWTARHGDAN